MRTRDRGGSERKRRWRAKPENRELENERCRKRYANDPEYRERRKAEAKAAMRKCRADPEYREHKNATRRERYANDPEYRERHNATSREWHRTQRGWYEPGGMATDEEMSRFQESYRRVVG